ncbi:MAG: hypothetical protein B7Z68_03780 [Acidobacteria bacterium 21-70-11]|nr:MAG: hypothetical protein B7Z68_03780 [Acidobacteria bacterium 21-70-11]OYW00089.1 MAG: hypothetical protein B7Z61_13700 [Acidobacteria bacterium 37-71-11]
MARPDYLICLECESEVEDFIWRDGEVRRATCEVCGNSDVDAFSLPEEFEPEEDEEEEEAEGLEDEEEDEDLDDYEEEDEDEEEKDQ